MKSKKIFINYAKENQQDALKLYKGLISEGHDPWIDHEKIIGGQKWKKIIEQQINKSDIFIAVLSKIAVDKRGYVQKEIKQALEVLDYLPEGQVFLIPVRLEECDPSHEKIKDHQWIDLFPDWNNGFQKLINSIEIGFGDSNPRKSHESGSSKRIQSTITIEAMEQMKDLQKRVGAPSEAELIRRSIELYKYIINAQEQGASIKLEKLKEDGSTDDINLFIPST